MRVLSVLFTWLLLCFPQGYAEELFSNLIPNCDENASELKTWNDDKTNLCSGTQSAAPVKCYEETLNLEMWEDDRVLLCSGASSIAPVNCYKETLKLEMWEGDRVDRCKANSEPQ